MAAVLTRPPGDTKSTHGGRREGAGRPPIPNALMRRTVYLEQKHLTTIALWQYVNRCSFGEAVRQMIDELERPR
jgi:hypothetical protein